ncbi:MAG: sulfatase-like hydrolase/transferase [bacterium]|nr:sulfatase-like hydrolase/transferase [bacterium]
MKAGYGTTAFQWADQQVADCACDYLKEKATGDDDRPFAAVCSIWLPHCPFIAPKDLFEYYHNRVDVPEVEAEQPETVTRFRRHRDVLDLDAERVRVARAAYFGLVEFVDGLVGQVLDTLKKTGLADHTLVIYCSDHGEMAGEHGCWWKSNYYEGSAGVPLIARLPGVVPEGAVQDAVCNLVDIGVTLTDVAGGEPIRATAGRSLWPTLQGNHPVDWVDETYSEFVEAKYTGETQFPSRMVRSGKWKLWVYGDDEELAPSLFDLEADPDEVNDLAGDPAHQDVVQDLLRKIYDGWDPKAVCEASLAATADHHMRSRWAQAVKPQGPDEVLAPPPEELEDDVVLV